MTDVNWNAIVLTIKRSRRWPRKTIAGKMDVTPNTLSSWEKGKTEPKYSQGVALLRLANSDQVERP